MDKYTEVTRQGLGSRLMGSIVGALLGLVLFVAAFPVLWLNEGYAVKMARSLSQGAREVISVPAGRVDPANEGKLVHVAGHAATADTVTDPVFQVSRNAIRLHRKVEMYQWRESSSSRKEKSVGGSETTRTTYSYSQEWSEHPIESSGFKRPEGHQNPAMPFRSADYTAGRVTLGAFRLNGNQVSRLSGSDPVDASGATLPDSLRERARPVESGFQTGDPGSPKIGDLRVTWSEVRPGDVSVVARQMGDTFAPYQAKAGGTVELVAMGIVSPDVMFASAQTGNTIRTWILRGAGFLAMLIGLALVFRPLATLGDVVPLVGSVLRAGTGLLSFSVALCLSLLTIAAAWIAYRPLLGIALLGGAALVIYGTARLRKSRGRARSFRAAAS